MIMLSKELLSPVLIAFFLFLTYTFRTEGHVHRGHISHSAIRSVEMQNPDIFVDNLFKKYGSNDSLNLEQFRNLLATLKIGNNKTKTRSEAKPRKSDRDATLSPVEKNKDGQNNGGAFDKCYSGRKLFDMFSLNSSGIDKGNFEKLCPAIVEQIDSKSCQDDQREKSVAAHIGKRSTKKEAWGYGFASVTLISVSSIFGAFVVPFMSHKVYRFILMFMVSLAVGVLCGSGLFHLLPSTFGLGADGSYDYLWKCLTIAGGIYLFFVMEYLMKMYVRFREMKHNPDSETYSHNRHGGESDSVHGHSNDHRGKEKNGTIFADNEKDSDNISNIAGVQLVMYKTESDFHDTHANSFCPSNELSEKPELKNIPCFKTRGGSGSSNDNSVDVVSTKPGKKGNLAQVAPVAWMIVCGDALHNFIDGLAIGASFTNTVFQGISTALAIFCEELPHELGDFAVLLNAGMTYKQAMAFNFLSACSCYVGLVIGLMLGYATSAVKWIYALAGGMFIYISLVDMMAEATEMSVKAGGRSIKKNLQTFALQNFGMVFGFTVMFILALYGSNLSI